MTSKEKTVITIETLQKTFVRRAKRNRTIWCERCAAQVEMFPPEQAARILRTTARAVYRAIEAGELHFIETQTGALLTCLQREISGIRHKYGEEYD